MIRARMARLLAGLALAPSLAACSFFAPSLDEYANGTAGAGAGTAGASGGGGSNSGGAGPTGGIGASAGTLLAGGGGLSEGGWPGVVALGIIVPDSELVPEAPATTGLPVFAAFTSYDIAEAVAVQPARETPLFTKYESSTTSYWDNLVAEQIQARVPVVMFPSHGAFTTDDNDLSGPSPMNPRQLSRWIAALERAGATDQFLTACHLDLLSMADVSNHLHGKASGSEMDLALSSDWTDVFFARGIQPMFDTIPESYWFRHDGHPLIQMGEMLGTSFKNEAGNLSKLLSAVADAFHAAYGAYPAFVLDPSWVSADAGVTSNRYVLGQNRLLRTPSPSQSFSTFQGLTFGTIVPGYADPAYYEQSGPEFHNPQLMIPRKTVDSAGTQVITLVTGLAAAVQKQAYFTVLQDFTGVKFWEGFYRSNHPDWSTPNEYLNLVRRYADPKTSFVRLDAEGCDRFEDSTPGNSGKAFRRSGDLDVRALSANSGWVVTNTAAGEWLEFANVDFSAGLYDFVAQYSTNGPAGSMDKRVQLFVDGEPLTPIIAPDTVNADTFQNTRLALSSVSHGTHTLRVLFLDGLVDLDALFVKKVRTDLSLKTSDGSYLSAVDGGGSTVVASASTVTQSERFTFDDLNGGGLSDGDRVHVQSQNGLYLTVVPASGLLTADQRQPSGGATFTVKAMSGNGTVVPGTKIALSTDDAHYLSVGAGGRLDGTGAGIGAAQTFTVSAGEAAVPR